MQTYSQITYITYANAPRPCFCPELTQTLHIFGSCLGFFYYQIVLLDGYCYIRIKFITGATKLVNRVRIEPKKIFEKCHRYYINTSLLPR